MRILSILAVIFVALVTFTPAVPAEEKPAAQTETPAAPVPEIVSVAGEWEGTLTGGLITPVATIRLVLNQDGREVNGTYDWAVGTRGRRNVEVKGVVDGNRLVLTIPSVAYGRIEATIHGDEMEGTYRGGSGWTNQLKAKRVR